MATQLKDVSQTTDLGEELLDRARALVPGLRERAIDTAKAGVVPDVSIQEMQDAELFKTVQPKRYGGFEIPFDQHIKIVTELSKGCGASGWVYAVVCDHNMSLGMFTPEAQEDIWGEDPHVRVSSGLAPSGKVTRVDGGWNIEGRWQFSSGSDHCTWIFVQALCFEEEGAPPVSRYFLLPREDYEILDTWDVVGLAGTGSKDIEIAGAFVPDHRTVTSRELDTGTGPGRAVNDGPLYRIPRISTIPYSLVAPAVGIAQSFLDHFVEEVKQKSSRGFKLSEQTTIQMRVAEAAAEIDSAELLLGRACKASMATAEAGDEFSIELKARNRRDMAYCSTLCMRAAERLFTATGGAGLFRSNEAHRYFLDVRAAGAHFISSWDIAGSIYGRVALDLPPGHPSI